MTFTKDGQTVIEYDMVRSDCKFKVYGEETEQIMEIMDSVEIR